MEWERAFESKGLRVLSREMLISSGATGKSLTVAVGKGELVRARRDHYVLPTESTDLRAAVRVGGRVDCVSALSGGGVFAFDTTKSHVRIDHAMSRMRSTRSRFIPLTGSNRHDVKLHWWPLKSSENEPSHAVGIADALAASLRCQQPWHALASLDSALHLGLISRSGIAALFEHVPERVQHLLPLVDGRAEAGQETVLRMIVLEAGLDCDLQPTIPDVGRVDLIVEGALALEADSRLAHDGWEHHVRDRHRDLVLARNGYMSLRPAYQHTMFEPVLVRQSIFGLLNQSRHFRRSIL